MCRTYVDDIQLLEEYQIFLFFFLCQVQTNNILHVFFFRISNCVLFFSLLLSLSSFFACHFCILFRSQTGRERERQTSNRLCHSDTSKMMFDNAFNRYLFILLLSLLSVHFTVSQTISTDIPSTGMLIATVDHFYKFHKTTNMQIYVFFSYLWIYIKHQMFCISLFQFYRTIVNFRVSNIRSMRMFSISDNPWN
jgi:hypothetical protein